MDYKITALSLQKRNRQRVNVFLDGEFAFGLARIVAGWLEVGQVIDDDKIAELKAEDERETAYQRALNLLNYRARAGAEIRKALSKQDYSEEVMDQVMERLQRAGLVNDQRFADSWVENRNEFQPRSRRALAYELRQRGVDQQAIEQSLEQLDEETLAYQAALKHARKLRELEWQDFRKKMLSFLARRGFPYEISADATRRVWDEMQEGNLDETHPV